MRKSLRTRLTKGQDDNMESTAVSEQPSSKRLKLTPVKMENRDSKQVVSERKASLLAKKELSWSPSKRGHRQMSTKLESQTLTSTPVKEENECHGNSSNDNSFEKLLKVDENKDPAGKVRRPSPRKCKSPVKLHNVKDEESDDSDDEQNSFSYAEMREKNLRENELFFASLGIDQAKEMLQLSAMKPKKPSQKGLKIEKKTKEILPRRQSLRIKRIDPEGNHLPEPDPVIPEVVETRLPSGPVKMEDCFYSKSVPDSEEHLGSFRAQMVALKMKGKSKLSFEKETSNFLSGLSRMTISERGVAKVVPERIFSVCWHPAPSPLIAIAGDKWGTVGMWSVGSENEDHMVAAFKQHKRPVSCVMVAPEAQHKLYSCSYDATLRCGDFETGVFDEVFSVPEEDDDLFRNFCFYDEFRTLLVSQYSGNVSLVDVRTPKTTAEQVYKVSHKSLRTVSVHPTQRDYFITAGTDTNICLWDIRKIAQKSAKPLQVLSTHSRAIASAYFSPDGHKILSSAADDNILVFNVPPSFSGSAIELSKRIKHNNCTGRWLTNFQPTWHPTIRDVFVVGSMARPREIQVFDSSKGTVMHTLTNEDYLGSVCSLNVFHPQLPHTLVGGNSSGRLHVFM